MRLQATVVLIVMSHLPVMAATLSLDADTAVDLALEASRRSDAAASRVTAAAEQVASADTRRLPSLELSGSVSRRSSVPEAAFPESLPEIGGFVLFPDIQNVYRAGAVARQPLLTGGAISGSRAVARHQEAAASASAAQVSLELRFEARLAYWRTVDAAAQVDVAQAEVDRATRLLEDARALRAAGMAVRADELGAEARRAAAEVRLIEAQAELANREAELRSLVDVPEATRLQLTDHGSEPPAIRGPVPDLIDEAYGNRPELAVLKARREVVRGRGDVAAAPTRPRVSLIAQWDVARPNERFLPLEDEWNTSWSVGLVAGWKVFDGERTGAEIAALEAEGAALDADVDELQRRVALDVETAHRRLEAAVAAVAAARAAVSAAVAREADSRDRYASGLATAAEVLDAQAELAESERMLAGARSGAWMADAALRRSVGR